MNNPINPNEYYSLNQMAKVLKIDRRTLRKNLEDQKPGGIPFIGVGEQVRILGGHIFSNAGSQAYQAPTQPRPKTMTGESKVETGEK